MKLTILITGIISSLICGFLFAGLFGAFCFALLLSLTIYLYRTKCGIKFSKIGIAGLFVTLYILGYFLMYLGGLIGANKEITRKLELIKGELKAMGHNPKWVIISQKRNKWINKELKHSVSNSNHLYGTAIDVYVLDINGDNLFNKEDISIIEQANNVVVKEHPDLIGCLGDYFLDKNDYFTKHMIHFDTHGIDCRYTQ